jgi:micrococcal nuclease
MALTVVALTLYACSGNADGSALDGTAARDFETATVARVIDGDTVELGNGERVRYIGIDTPETVHPEKPVECYGPEATERNRELVEGKSVELLGDGPDRDGFGRLLRFVFVDGTFVNAELVWEGFAHASSYGDETRFDQTLVQLERSARESNRGLWATCPR